MIKCRQTISKCCQNKFHQKNCHQNKSDEAKSLLEHILNKQTHRQIHTLPSIYRLGEIFNALFDSFNFITYASLTLFLKDKSSLGQLSLEKMSFLQKVIRRNVIRTNVIPIRVHQNTYLKFSCFQNNNLYSNLLQIKSS